MIDPITNLPSRSQTNEAFAESADKAWPQLNRYAGQANALATDVNDKLQAVIGLEASAQVSATSAAASAIDAAAAVNSAAQIAGATKWLSGTNYTDGKAVWSPASKLTYRKNGDGLSNIDPGVDVTGWVPLTPTGGGAGGAIITGDIVLSASSPAAMIVAPTKHGEYAILPDGTTLPKGITQYAFYNQSEIPFGIKNKAAVTLGWVPPFSGASLLLADNSTAASVWGTIGLQKIAVTSELKPTNQSTNYGDIIRRVTLDANREFLFFNGGGDYGCVYDSSTNQYGALTSILSYVPSSNYCDLTLVGADLLLLVWNTSLNPIQVKAMTISVSGNSIAPNAGGTQTYTGTYSGQYQSRTLTIGNTHNTGWVEGGDRYVMGITISGTTPSFGTPRALGTPATNSPPLLLTTGGMLRAITSSASFVTATPFTISGNNLTPGTAASQVTNSYNILRAFVNGNGNIFAQHHDGVAVFKLTGTTENVSNYGGFLSTQNLNFSCITPISTNKVLVAIRSSADVYVYLVTDTNGTASGNYTGWSFGGSAFSNITSLNVDGTVADVNGYFDASIFVSNSTEVRSINVKCAGGTLVLNKVNYQAIAASVAYPSQGQDTFGLPEAGQLRTLSRDIWTRAGYVASLQMSNHEANYLYGISENIAVRGKTNSIGWASKRTFQNDGLVLRKIEVCE